MGGSVVAWLRMNAFAEVMQIALGMVKGDTATSEHNERIAARALTG